MVKSNGKLIVGWRETVDLPLFKLRRLRAKVDTGAYTGALHCHTIEEVTRKDTQILRFSVLDPTHPKYRDKMHPTKQFRSKFVTSSSGNREERYVIQTKLRIYDQLFDTKLTLTDRSQMKFPLLLGRKFLKGKFLVDVSKHDLGQNRREQEKL